MNKYKKNIIIVNSFLKYIELNRRYSNHTIRAYKKDLFDFIDYLGEDVLVVEAKKYDIHEFVTQISKSLSTKSLARKIATLKSFYKYLVDDDIIEINITSSIKIPKIEKKLPNYLTVDEMNNFFEKTISELEISKRDILIIDLLYSTGIRVSECAGIRFSDLSLNRNSIRIYGKGKKSRLVLYGDKTNANLASYIESIDKSIFLFPSNHKKNKSKNNCISTRTIYNIVKKYIKLVSNNEKLGPHSLRHSFATHLLQGGADLMAIKDMLGHESLSATQIYTHLDAKKMKEIYDKSHPHAK